ncbi:MAG: non-heme iron oxygenase ferredoxin subunit [Pirellulaceae bacterium]|nr:non-heme iron oxygenase ferredoxin subunit [Pirellulaceae bacterium]
MTTGQSDFVQVASVSQFPVDGRLCVEVDDRFLVLVHYQGQFYCLDDVCTHDGGPLGEGDLEGNCLICPRHGARFDVCTGKALTMPATEPTATHAVRVDGDRILVKLSH